MWSAQPEINRQVRKQGKATHWKIIYRKRQAVHSDAGLLDRDLNYNKYAKKSKGKKWGNSPIPHKKTVSEMKEGTLV